MTRVRRASWLTSEFRSSTDAVVGQFRSWDDYFIPGTSVLRNRLGFTSVDELLAAELKLSGNRIVGLALQPVVGEFDLDHLCEVHRRIFHSVYVWAGQIRVGPEGRMSKTAPDILHFAPGDPAAPLIPYDYFQAGPELVRYVQSQLAALDGLGRRSHGLTDELVGDLAEVWSELNVAHPFREGNTRTQLVFFFQWLALRGMTLDLATLAPGGTHRQAFIEARFHAQGSGHSRRLADVLGDLISPIPPSREHRIRLHRNLGHPPAHGL